MPNPPRIKTLLLTLALGLVAGGMFTAYTFRPWGPSLAKAVQSRKHTRFTLQMLDREELLFLVTDRVVTQVVVEHNEHSLLLGPKQGHLIATVSLLYGIDLKHLTDADIEQDGQTVWVTVPQPELIEFAADPQMQFISKRTGLVFLADWLTGKDLEDELRGKIKDQAVRFVNDHHLGPDPGVILARLNRFGPTLAAGTGLHLRFRYVPSDLLGGN
ncbi:MAG: DUF4230 domain-containing protein [Phycisphaeraceae bacterium]